MCSLAIGEFYKKKIKDLNCVVVNWEQMNLIHYLEF